MTTRRPGGPPDNVLGLYTQTPCGMDDPIFIVHMTVKMRTEECIREHLSYDQTLVVVRASISEIYPDAPAALVDGAVTTEYFKRMP